MCELWKQQQETVDKLSDALDDHLDTQSGYHYALLVLVTDTPFDRAVAYLKDTGSPKAAEGRLLLRAAERALREYGDTPNEEEGN